MTTTKGQGIDRVAQDNVIKILQGESGTFHAGLPTVQRTLYGSGDSYESNPLRTPELWTGLDAHNDSHVSNDMVWYRNIESPVPPTGRNDIAEIMEHILHTIHMLGIKGAVEGSLQALGINDLKHGGQGPNNCALMLGGALLNQCDRRFGCPASGLLLLTLHSGELVEALRVRVRARVKATTRAKARARARVRAIG